MKLKEALDLIKLKQRPKGFMVQFNRVEGDLLISDHFPEWEKGEPLITTAAEAWNLAIKFAEGHKHIFEDIYVLNDDLCFAVTPGFPCTPISNRE